LDNIIEKLEVCSNSIRDGSDLEDCRISRSRQRDRELAMYTTQVDNYTNYLREYEQAHERDLNVLYARYHIWGNPNLTSLKTQLQENIKYKTITEKRVNIWNACQPIPNAQPIPIEPRPKKSKSSPKADVLDVDDMTVEEIKEELRKRGRSDNGSRSLVAKRLRTFLEKEEMEHFSDSMSDEDDIDYSVPKYDAENMILKYGTKLAKIMEYLTNMWKKNPDAKVIIFSKFSIQLEKIRMLLDGEHIRSVVVAGNVARRNKAIVEFKNACKVILLGLGTAASGTNLTEATHVILVDPMSGTAKEIKAIESQAIARAHRRGQEKVITIVRFLMRDTIELSNYIDVYGTSKIPGEKEEVKTKKPLIVKSHSAATLLANKPGLQKSGSLAQLLDQEFI